MAEVDPWVPTRLSAAAEKSEADAYAKLNPRVGAGRWVVEVAAPVEVA